MELINVVKDAFLRVIEFNLAPFYFVRDALFGAPESTDFEPPYTPPFTGGQCDGIGYAVIVNFRYQENGSEQIRNNDAGTYTGAVTSIKFDIVSPTTVDLTIVWDNGEQTSFFPSWFSRANASNIQLDGFDVFPRGGGNDECGDPPNPNPPQPTSENGLSDAPFPNLDDGAVVKEGLAPPNLAAALAAALAALRAALDLAQLAAAIADALQALKDALDELKEEDDKENVEVIQFDFGEVKGDGFLRLYPQDNLAEYEALYVDFQFRDIPQAYGRFFGRKSPNYFRFRELGYIAFVSPTFGIINVTKFEWVRCSVGVPSGAIGFYYHLGLNEVIKANVTAFYEKPLPPMEE